MDIVWCLLHDKKLHGFSWGEVICVTTILFNLQPSKQSSDKTPNKLFYKKKPSIAHLWIFGSLAHIHRSIMLHKKLDPHSFQCIILNFDDKIKGYHLYDPKIQKVIISRDIQIQKFDMVHTNSLMEFESPVQFIGGFVNLPTTPTQLLPTSMFNPSSSPRFATPIMTSLVPSSPLPTSMSNPSSSPRSIVLIMTSMAP